MYEPETKPAYPYLLERTHFPVKDGVSGEVVNAFLVEVSDCDYEKRWRCAFVLGYKYSEAVAALYDDDGTVLFELQYRSGDRQLFHNVYQVLREKFEEGVLPTPKLNQHFYNYVDSKFIRTSLNSEYVGMIYEGAKCAGEAAEINTENCFSPDISSSVLNILDLYWDSDWNSLVYSLTYYIAKGCEFGGNEFASLYQSAAPKLLASVVKGGKAPKRPILRLASEIVLSTCEDPTFATSLCASSEFTSVDSMIRFLEGASKS
jgi:hypothetical protein